MGYRRLAVNLADSTLSVIKKRAFSEGTSQSEIARKLIEFAINNRFDAGEGPVPEEHRAVTPRAAVMDVLKAGGSGIPSEALRFLIQDLAKTENLLRQLSRLLSPGNFKEHEERVRMAEQKAVRILKNLKLDEIEDVDKIEVREMTPEETAQMLKEMGIE